MWIYLTIGFGVVLVVLLCIALAIASFSSENFKNKWDENEKRRNTYGLTTLEYVNLINNDFFDGKLRITGCRDFEDHYSGGVVALSQKTMGSNSLASLSVVSHELGHALQDQKSDKLKKHGRLRFFGRVCGLFFLPLEVVGAVLSVLSIFNILASLFLYIGLALMGVGLLIFFFAILLKYKEIKIEKEASKFAIDFLREFLTEPEIRCCQEFLNSARLTYWAGLFRTMLSWTFLTQKDKMFY